MTIILVPMLLLACIRNLKYLSPVSMLANILQFTGLGIIFYYVLQVRSVRLESNISYNNSRRTSRTLGRENPLLPGANCPSTLGQLSTLLR